LARGESKTVEIPLKAQTLAYWDESKNSFVVEEEPIQLMVGSSSADVKLERALKSRTSEIR